MLLAIATPTYYVCSLEENLTTLNTLAPRATVQISLLFLSCSFLHPSTFLETIFIISATYLLLDFHCLFDRLLLLPLICAFY